MADSAPDACAAPVEPTVSRPRCAVDGDTVLASIDGCDPASDLMSASPEPSDFTSSSAPPPPQRDIVEPDLDDSNLELAGGVCKAVLDEPNDVSTAALEESIDTSTAALDHACDTPTAALDHACDTSTAALDDASDTPETELDNASDAPKAELDASRDTLKVELDASSDTTNAEREDLDDAPKADRDDLDDTLNPHVTGPNCIQLPFMSTRTGMNEDKIRALFSKHGLSHQPLRRSIGEPPRKCRRVEKPIRLKMHWRCHECGNLPGREKKCAKCGHGRCDVCERAPAKAVKELVDNTRRAKEQDERRSKDDSPHHPMKDIPHHFKEATPHHSKEKAPLVDTSPVQTEIVNLEAVEEKVLPPPRESLIKTECTTAATCEVNPPPPGLSLTLNTRPSAGEKPTVPSKVHISCRSCDQCATPLPRDDSTACVKCVPERPSSYPRRPAKLQRWPSDEKPASSSKPDVSRRVYKKPRVRVRYTCDHCDTVFTEHNTCTNCGHGRCKDCVRYPPRRTSSPDSTLVEPVARRVEAPDHQPQPRLAAAD